MGKAKTQRTDELTLKVRQMIQDVAANGGEYLFKTVKGEVKDVHHTTAEQLKERTGPASAEHDDPQVAGVG